MKAQKIAIILMISSSFCTMLSAQSLEYGGQVGVIVKFGNPVNRLGISLNGFIYRDFIQANIEIRAYCNISNYGPPLSYPELVHKIGLVGAVGTPDTLNFPIYSSVSNFTKRPYSIGYSYNYYHDPIGTKQHTGTASIQLGQLYYVMENDGFAGPAADKFRTGTAALFYWTEDIMLGINLLLWTGDPFTNFIDTRTETPDYPGRYGYRAMNNSTYGNYSHGILSLQGYYKMPHYQIGRLQLGADWERFRHLFQNVLIHDTWYFPKGWITTPHIPMKDINGDDYLFKPYQRLKPADFVGDFSLNSSWFY